MSCKKTKILTEDRYGNTIYHIKYNKKDGHYFDKAWDQLYVRTFTNFYKNGKLHGKCIMTDEIDPTEITYYNYGNVIHKI